MENGVITERFSSNVARLVLADISDPVNPIILEKDFANDSYPYHFDVLVAWTPMVLSA